MGHPKEEGMWPKKIKPQVMRSNPNYNPNFSNKLFLHLDIVY